MREFPFLLTTAGMVLAAACGGVQPGAGAAAPVAAGAVEASSGVQQGTDTAQAAKGPSCYAQCGDLLREAGRLFRRAERVEQGPGGARAHAEAGEAYVDAWRGCSLAVPDGEDLGCTGAGEVVARMVRSLERAELPARAVFAHLVAMDRRWRADDAPGERSGLTQAVEGAEKLAKAGGPKEQASSAASAAAYGRLALGDAAGAARNAALFSRLAGKDGAEERVLLAVALASYHNDANSAQAALGALGPRPPEDSPRQQILWHAERGRALAGLKRGGQASEAFGRVLQVWQSIAAAERVKALGRAQPSPMQGRERVVEGVGAAHFFFGEQAREKASKLPFPRYSGPDSVPGVAAFVNEKIGAYVRERQALLLAADEAYGKVSQIQPVPPPRWVVASAARVGEMWSGFADDVTRSAAPAPVTREVDLESGYRRTLQASMRPVVEKARRAFTVCRDAAARMRVESSYARSCDAWLREHPGE